ncbi:hypothetical protein THAOC_17333 [Thalassiosira oceanica]|uniref:Uncharacterized protein n=1 Tax=Thalassiosira oceanica TaxID=159749 RepID=K0SMB8_THAOC|nr:hypothetical protein THAOC_17333 [Thalassiosira oceanica]|eukprot:EJK62071.1 hypothetical protein THAOC_17333 [Thalassiosira oceanica]
MTVRRRNGHDHGTATSVAETGGPEVARAAPQYNRGGLCARRCRRRRCDIAPKLFGHQDDNEGIRLRRREADGPIPQIPAVWADVFGSFIVGVEVGKAPEAAGGSARRPWQCRYDPVAAVPIRARYHRRPGQKVRRLEVAALLYHKVARRAFNSRSTTKESGDANARGMALFPGFRRLIVGFEVGKARLSGGRRRPPAARHEGRGNADTIPWLRFVSASVIIVGPAKRCVGEACFVRMVGSDREWRGQEKKSPCVRQFEFPPDIKDSRRGKESEEWRKRIQQFTTKRVQVPSALSKLWLDKSLTFSGDPTRTLGRHHPESCLYRRRVTIESGRL